MSAGIPMAALATLLVLLRPAMASFADFVAQDAGCYVPVGATALGTTATAGAGSLIINPVLNGGAYVPGLTYSVSTPRPGDAERSFILGSTAGTWAGGTDASYCTARMGVYESTTRMSGVWFAPASGVGDVTIGASWVSDDGATVSTISMTITQQPDPPTTAPTALPTGSPAESVAPSGSPSSTPTTAPSGSPSSTPTTAPSVRPTVAERITPSPTAAPATPSPTTPSPTTPSPTMPPGTSGAPSFSPTVAADDTATESPSDSDAGSNGSTANGILHALSLGLAVVIAVAVGL